MYENYFMLLFLNDKYIRFFGPRTIPSENTIFLGVSSFGQNSNFRMSCAKTIFISIIANFIPVEENHMKFCK